jgi:hypothetical protein
MVVTRSCLSGRPGRFLVPRNVTIHFLYYSLVYMSICPLAASTPPAGHQAYPFQTGQSSK